MLGLEVPSGMVQDISQTFMVQQSATTQSFMQQMQQQQQTMNSYLAFQSNMTLALLQSKK